MTPSTKPLKKITTLTKYTRVQEQNTPSPLLNQLLQKARDHSLNDTEYSQLLPTRSGQRLGIHRGSAHVSRYDQSRYFSIENVYSILADSLSPALPLRLPPPSREPIPPTESFFFPRPSLQSLQKQIYETLDSLDHETQCPGSHNPLGLSPIPVPSPPNSSTKANRP